MHPVFSHLKTMAFPIIKYEGFFCYISGFGEVVGQCDFDSTRTLKKIWLVKGVLDGLPPQRR